MTKKYAGTKTKDQFRDLWRSPKDIFNYYDRTFNFTTDVAASFENRLCRDHRSEKFCGLNTGWGERNFCNPPFSNMPGWVNKAIYEMNKGRLTVMVIPADTSTQWFKLAFNNCAECHLITGRLAFISAETGKKVNGNNKGSAIFIFNPYSTVKSIVRLIDRDEMQ